MGRPNQSIGSSAAGLLPNGQRIAVSSGPAPPNGWRWSFLIRTAEAAGKRLTSDGQKDHPTRRSRKLARLEAVLLVADGALSLRKLAQFATLADATEARQLVQQLNDRLDRGGAAFRIEKVATGFRMMTRPQFSMWLDRLHNRQAKARLSPPMLETLAIVAYRQPATRADIEKIRGVQASEMLRQLMDRGLVRITGEDDSLGRPFLYGTTRQFLEEYGFGSLDDLPMADTLRRQDKSAEVINVEEASEDEAPALLVEQAEGETLDQQFDDEDEDDEDEDDEDEDDEDEDD
ncbi:MAG: SMC-Scp complex subunit ScpB, partial [Rhodopirellula sp.]|nr:SMC-Scp complex subunit ScpB [Rhodopirellula sp.]